MLRHRFKKHKYNAKPTEVDGIKFASKIEASYYLKLKELQGSGRLIFFLRQVPLHLPGNVRYVVDFVEFHEDGEIIFTDIKGMETENFATKKKMVEAVYPIKINVVKKV